MQQAVFVIAAIAAVRVLGSLTGCSTSTPAEPIEDTRNLLKIATVTPSQGRGFYHSITRSRFVSGDNTVPVSALGMNKYVGSEGVFAVNSRNGSVRAILNANSKFLTGYEPFAMNADAHNTLMDPPKC